MLNQWDPLISLNVAQLTFSTALLFIMEDQGGPGSQGQVSDKHETRTWGLTWGAAGAHIRKTLNWIELRVPCSSMAAVGR